jgi:hypothetical protein
MDELFRRVKISNIEAWSPASKTIVKRTLIEANVHTVAVGPDSVSSACDVGVQTEHVAHVDARTLTMVKHTCDSSANTEHDVEVSVMVDLDGVVKRAVEQAMERYHSKVVVQLEEIKRWMKTRT